MGVLRLCRLMCGLRWDCGGCVMHSVGDKVGFGFGIGVEAGRCLYEEDEITKG